MPTSPKNLTELTSRILEQLSLSSWLPAVTLVGGVVFTAELRRTGTSDPGAALDAIGHYGLGAFVIAAVAVVIAALLTQAFALQSTRLLEGQWGTDRASSFLAGRAIALESRRRNRVLARLRATERRGRAEAAAALDASDDRDNDRDEYVPIDLVELFGDDWIKLASAATLRRLEQLRCAERCFPEAHRILPTRLGNTLRAYTDRLDLGHETIGAYLLRHRDDLPAELADRHDQQRVRLDLYCTLTAVFGLLALVSVATLTAPDLRLAGVGFAAAELAVASLCSRAAIAGVHDYGAVLVAIDDLVRAHVDISGSRPDGDGPQGDDQMAILPPTGSPADGEAEDDEDSGPSARGSVDRARIHL